jgi:phosphatidate cytidylyltransferase
VVSPGKWIAISLIISIAGTYGDLIESMLKRSMGVKDSGTVMPGHGGFLDRFDSALLSFPIVFLFISLFAD